MARSARADFLRGVADEIEAKAFRARRPLAERLDSVLFVGIDGVDGAGKTTFADELADVVHGSVIRASVDGFHNPRSIRYARGRGSPRGYFEDSYDYDGLRKRLLEPLRASPPGPFVRAIFDHRT